MLVSFLDYDLPERDENLESYVHRVGRTGRVGNEGKATSFFDPSANSDHAFFYIEVRLLPDENLSSVIKTGVFRSYKGSISESRHSSRISPKALQREYECDLL